MPMTQAIRQPAFHMVPQLARFAVAGLAITALSALVYLMLSTLTGAPPLASNVVSHACGVLFGFQIHSRWSFREDARHDGYGRLARFAAGSGASFLLNTLWVWALVNGIGAPIWAPVPLMVLATPVASFAINRAWVFGRA